MTMIRVLPINILHFYGAFIIIKKLILMYYHHSNSKPYSDFTTFALMSFPVDDWSWDNEGHSASGTPEAPSSRYSVSDFFFFDDLDRFLEWWPGVL